MAHLPNPNATLTTPSVRKAGTYQLHVIAADLSSILSAGYVRCVAYRNGQLITNVRAATAAQAVREARRNVRNARKCGF